MPSESNPRARLIRVRGVVQGVGFRPFVYRLARANTLSGWVLNQQNGVEIHVEGCDAGIQAFVSALTAESPPAADISSLEILESEPAGLSNFTIRETQTRQEELAVRVVPQEAGIRYHDGGDTRRCEIEKNTEV